MARIKISELLKNGATFLGQKNRGERLGLEHFVVSVLYSLMMVHVWRIFKGVIDYDNFDEEQLKAISTGCCNKYKRLTC